MSLRILAGQRVAKYLSEQLQTSAPELFTQPDLSAERVIRLEEKIGRLAIPEILQDQMSIHVGQNYESHSLREALQRFDHNLFNHLLKHKKTWHEASDLHFMIQQNEIAHVQRFLESIPEDFSGNSKDFVFDSKDLFTPLFKIQDENGATVFHWALKMGLEDLFSQMLDLVPENKRANLLMLKDCMGKTVFHLAIEEHSSNLILKILDKIPQADRADLLIVQENNKATVLQ